MLNTPRAALAAFIASITQRSFIVALSGGCDSRTLLHFAASLRDELGFTLRAIHVDHGLNPESQRWSQRCAQWCADVGVALQVERVAVDRVAELGLEGAARAARHAAFAKHLGDDEVLLAAHHRDDQAETFLLRALRAPGFDGLAGMRPWRRFARGHMARPWLSVSREAIHAEATSAGLEWIDDPSNADVAHDRNFLRHEILPRLSQRWPSAAAALAQSAARSADLLDLALPEVQRLLARYQRLDSSVLDVRVLEETDGTAIAVIKTWLRELALPNPPPTVLIEMLRQMRDARVDREPEVRWPGGVLRRYRDGLYVEPAYAGTVIVETSWDPQHPLPLADGRMLPALPGLFDGPLRVTPRRGGEKIQLHADASRRPLRLLFQEYGVPPWVRDRLPYLWQGETLLAVGDLFLDAGFAARLQAAGLVWRVVSLVETDRGSG